jgi:hypothetical protein
MRRRHPFFCIDRIPMWDRVLRMELDEGLVSAFRSDTQAWKLIKIFGTVGWGLPVGAVRTGWEMVCRDLARDGGFEGFAGAWCSARPAEVLVARGADGVTENPVVRCTGCQGSFARSERP